MATKADRQQLSQAQLSAIDLLAIGSTITATAEAVKVSRQTVSEWVNRNAEFKAALNLRRLELWNEQSDRLRGLIPKALDCVESFLEDGDPADRLRASLGVLRMAGLGKLSEIGETDAAAIETKETWDYLAGLPLSKTLRSIDDTD